MTTKNKIYSTALATSMVMFGCSKSLQKPIESSKDNVQATVEGIGDVRARVLGYPFGSSCEDLRKVISYDMTKAKADSDYEAGSDGHEVVYASRSSIRNLVLENEASTLLRIYDENNCSKPVNK